MSDDYNFEDDEDGECSNCGGSGMVAGCFESTCSGSDCDPDEAEWCCNPQRCDWCRTVSSHDVSGLQQILADALEPSGIDTGDK